MDGSNHYSNGMANSASNNGYPAQPGISPQQLQQHSTTPHTLPPIQQQHTMAHIYPNSGPNTPRTPATPASANNLGHFPQQQQMGQSRQQYQPQQAQMGMQGNYQQQSSQAYRTSGSMMPQSTTAMSHPQAIAPAPPQNRIQQQVLRPMPASGGMMQQGMPSPYGQGNMISTGMMDMAEPPTHVVGSQGRRGILPSAPGRPPVQQSNGGKPTLIPTKDADGKFPCPHCTKTYLHAKHLKRHLLRHTGDRPYMCVLCRDTFSRSDILKRHFQKCSIRRGNPTGASHLSHAQAHLKKSHPGPHKNSPSMGNESDMMGGSGMQSMHDPALTYGVMTGNAGSEMSDEQALQQQLQPSRNGSLHMNNGGGRGGEPQGGSSRSSIDAGGYAGMSNQPGTNNPSFANTTMSNGQNNHSYSQISEPAGNGTPPMQSQPTQQSQSHSSNDRTTMAVFQIQDSSANVFSQIYPPNYYPQAYKAEALAPYNPIKSEPVHACTRIKAEPIHSYTQIKAQPSQGNSLLAGVYPGVLHATNPAVDFPNWNFQNHPLKAVSDRLIYFSNLPDLPMSNRIKQHLSSDNVKHFLENFSSFHGHFPILHMPSFRITEAYDGLLLAMVCIGAVYSSDRINPQGVRDMMEIAKAAIETRSQVYAKISRECMDAGYGKVSTGSGEPELELIAALVMMHALFTWHGTPEQREEARQQFPMIVALARKVALMQPATTGTAYSVLHQPRFNMEGFSEAHFDWVAWVEQEKRSRLMYMIFLADAAMVLYFNTVPSFQLFEIQLPLPADDAAWDASTSMECAEALGLYGATVAKARNPEGSCRRRQPEMHSAMRALLHEAYDLLPGTTNLYSKFVLVHALHMQLCLAQRQLSQATGQSAVLGSTSGGTSTPIDQYDWVTTSADAPVNGVSSSNNSSGRATPVEVADQSLKDTNRAFDKWKKAWDEDMMTQYPPPPRTFRRFGFCRDAVHFYYLAKCLMQNNQSLDSNILPDQHFSYVMSMLNYVKSWVVSDSAKRGEELGSLNDIDSNYAMTDMTLNMADLFKAYNKQIDSPVVGVHTNIGGR